MKIFQKAILGCALALSVGAAHSAEPVSPKPAEPVYVDDQGVMRWKKDGSELALFGANYSLASACDYRAAGYVGANRRRLIEQDMAHFSRLGWDGIRLCLWGDWENCDQKGNLITNDHLDLLDYAIYQAKQRGISILFTPITTYSSVWPDSKLTDAIQGFSRYYKKAELGTNPAAVAAQVNYLRQILDHVNPYTGVALKDEPAILFVELINEPENSARNQAEATAYIDALADAVRSTGCKKLLFYNVSQDFRVTPAIKASRAQGVSFAWYPSGLPYGHELAGNYLRTVDDYEPMQRADLERTPKLVYEFDSAAMNSGYMYPAMVRTFRSVGAQFIAMFSYDMLATAPYNLGWQTHFLNLVYSPKKAASAIIAAEATRMLPLNQSYGKYPANQKFGPFRVSYEQDSSELVTDEKFFSANDTRTLPPKPAALRKIVACGSSPVVLYEGNGLYFLDRIADGVWRLELYPDAVAVLDPFAQKLNYQSVCSRLISRPWPLTLHLPNLGDAYRITPLNAGNKYATTAKDARCVIEPGVFLLTRKGVSEPAALPEWVGGVGLREFVCPTPPVLPPQIVFTPREDYLRDQPLVFPVEVIANQAPTAVAVHVRTDDGRFREFPVTAGRGYRYEATVPTGGFAGKTLSWYFTVASKDATTRFPAEPGTVYSARLVDAKTPLALFDDATDPDRLAFTRIADTGRRGVFKKIPATADEPGALRIFFPLSRDRALDDYTASLPIKSRLAERDLPRLKNPAVALQASGSTDGQEIYVTLVETDGTAWSQKVSLSKKNREFVLPLTDFSPARSVMLPLGFPGRWNYWLSAPAGRGGPSDHVRLEAVDKLQISFRPIADAPKSDADAWADIQSVALISE